MDIRRALWTMRDSIMLRNLRTAYRLNTYGRALESMINGQLNGAIDYQNRRTVNRTGWSHVNGQAIVLVQTRAYGLGLMMLKPGVMTLVVRRKILATMP